MLWRLVDSYADTNVSEKYTPSIFRANCGHNMLLRNIGTYESARLNDTEAQHQHVKEICLIQYGLFKLQISELPVTWVLI